MGNKQGEGFMARNEHRLVVRAVLTLATVLLASAVTLVWGAGASLAVGAEKYYEDTHGNVCVGLEFTGGFPAASCTMAALTSGEDNTGLGEDVLNSDTGGSANVAVGFKSLYSNEFYGSRDTAVGDEAMFGNKNSADNTALGYRALYANGIEGIQNVALGQETLYSNRGGNDNTASGFEALFSNTNGSGNVADGYGALLDDTSGANNIASGYEAMVMNSTGSENVASGLRALERSKASENVAIGPYAGSRLTTGANNVLLGSNAGTQLTTGSSDIDLGNEGVAGEAETTRIGTAVTPETAATPFRAFMAGIYLKTIPGPACKVVVDSSGQLGCKVEKVKKGPSEVATLRAQVSRQQQEIDRLISEVKSIRR